MLTSFTGLLMNWLSVMQFCSKLLSYLSSAVSRPVKVFGRINEAKYLSEALISGSGSIVGSIMDCRIFNVLLFMRDQKARDMIFVKISGK